MPRIPERSPRYRTKSELATDLAFVLNADVKWGTQFAVLSDAVWAWSEFDGKIAGCRHWSPAAWKRRTTPRVLMHEHVVPKRMIIERLSKLRGCATPSKVTKVLKRWCVGVVLLRSEDALLTAAGLRSSMPDNWNRGSIWARYHSVGLKVVRDPGSPTERPVVPNRTKGRVRGNGLTGVTSARR